MTDPAALVVLGSTTCEDTAITRSRLVHAGVPFGDVDIDRDRVAAGRVERLNDGRRVTPTLVVGDARLVLAEPTLEQLGDAIRAAGYPYAPPEAVHFHGERTSAPIPLRTVPSADGSTFSLVSWRGRQQVALFLAHDARCLACLGYARQLLGRQSAFMEADARVVVVVAGTPDELGPWRHVTGDSTSLLADQDGAWKRTIATDLGWPADDTILLMLDRYLAPRAGSAAPEAGGLIDPAAAVEWLSFVALDCPECSGELPWALQDEAP